LRNVSSMQGDAFKYRGKKSLGVWLYNNGQKLYMLKATQVWRLQEVGPQLSSKRSDHIHNSHPRGWTTFTTLIQEVGPLHKSHPRGWDHINKSHPRIFLHVWSWNYDSLDKGWYSTILALFWQMCAPWSSWKSSLFLTYAYVKLCFLTVEILQSGGGGGLFTYFLKSAMKTKLNAHSHTACGAKE
jgi:hypothetical protein